MPANCPTPEKLDALLRGELPESEQERLAQHLEQCAECQRRLDELAGGLTCLLPPKAGPKAAPASPLFDIQARAPGLDFEECRPYLGHGDKATTDRTTPSGPEGFGWS
jgi:hypothetical protein